MEKMTKTEIKCECGLTVAIKEAGPCPVCNRHLCPTGSLPASCSRTREAGRSGGGLIEKDRTLTEKLKSMIYPGGPESLIDRGKRRERSGSGNSQEHPPR